MDLYQAKTVKPAVNGSQRTQVLAERTIYFNGKQQNANKNSEFPPKETTCLGLQSFVGSK
jgi:hypothetical protein